MYRNDGEGERRRRKINHDFYESAGDLGVRVWGWPFEGSQIERGTKGRRWLEIVIAPLLVYDNIDAEQYTSHRAPLIWNV